MLYWIVSLLLYLIPIPLAFYIDSKPVNEYRNVRYIFVTWLFIFLCFGYTIGTDWRNYEPWYIDFNIEGERMLTEPLSYLFFLSGYSIGIDFWLLIGFAKCCFLLSSLKLLSCISEKWLSCASLLIIAQYALLLICNPLRFMMGLIPVNVALILIYQHLSNQTVKSVKIKVLVLCVIAFLFHNSCFVYLPILYLCFLVPSISKRNSILLFASYMVITIVTSDIQGMNYVKNSILLAFSNYIDMRDYQKYEIASNNALLSIGNIFRIFTFGFILLTKNTVLKKYPKGYLIFGFAVIYCFLGRIFMLIPTGFRIPSIFTSFYIAYILLMFKSEKIYWKIILFYIILSFSVGAWKQFEYIPYTNSIPYMISGHMSLEDRYWYNFHEGRERTGEWDERYYLY